MLNPGFGLTFDDLYATAGLARVDGAFLAHLAAGDASLRDRLARRARRSGRARAAGRIGTAARAGAASRGLPRAACSACRPKCRRCRPLQNELAPLFACKRQVVQRKALNRYKADVASASTATALRAQLEAEDRRAARGPGRRTRLRARGGRVGQGRSRERGRHRSRAALCGVGGAQRRRQGAPQVRRAVQGAAQARFHAAGPGRSRNAQRRGDVAPAGGPPAPPRRLCADRSRHRSRRGPRPGALLHLVPRAAEGFVLVGIAREKDRRRRRTAVQEIALRRHAGGLSARGKDLRVPQAAHRRLGGGRAGDHLRRQSVGRGDGPSHLQRLHEGMHLPEAGAGRHSAVGNARAQGRPGAALGLRDLFAADALESAASAPPAAARRYRQARAGRRHGSGRVHARASPAQRRTHGRRHRRLEDRAAAGRTSPASRHAASASRSRRSATSPPCTSRSTIA